MSRYVTIRTQLRDMEMLRETLQCMGLPVEETARAEVTVRTPAGRVGFTRGADDTIGATAMEETLRADACTQFLRQVTQQYARRKVTADAARAGYRLAEEAVDADGTIRLVVRKW